MRAQTIKQALIALAFLAAANGANAVLITFDFTGGVDQNGDPLTFSSGGVDLWAYGDPGVAVDRNHGIGVLSSPDDDAQIEGRGGNEYVSFVLSETVRLVSVGFSWVDSNDDFEFYASGSYFSDVDIPGTNLYEFQQSWNVDWFAIGSDYRWDNFWIANITVDTAAGNVSVPEPGALLLFLAGLAGLAFFNRNRLRTAAAAV